MFWITSILTASPKVAFFNFRGMRPGMLNVTVDMFSSSDILVFMYTIEVPRYLWRKITRGGPDRRWSRSSSRLYKLIGFRWFRLVVGYCDHLPSNRAVFDATIPRGRSTTLSTPLHDDISSHLQLGSIIFVAISAWSFTFFSWEYITEIFFQAEFCIW